MLDDLTQLRRRLDDARKAFDAHFAPEGRNAAAMAAQVYDGGAIPSTVPRVFLTHPVGIACQEVADAAPSVVVGAASVPVLVLGPRVPVVGDQLEAWQIDGRWVAGVAMGGYPTVTIPGCGCATIPLVFTLSASSVCQFVGATIRWVPVPANLAGIFSGGPTNVFLSDATFTDGTDTWRYYVECLTGSLYLHRAYIFNSIIGGRYLDPARYVWGFASPGNTCVPFLQTVGGPINAGDCPANSLVLSP